MHFQGKHIFHFPACLPFQWRLPFNPFALRKAKIVYNFGLSECSRVKWKNLLPKETSVKYTPHSGRANFSRVTLLHLGSQKKLLKKCVWGGGGVKG